MPFVMIGAGPSGPSCGWCPGSLLWALPRPTAGHRMASRHSRSSVVGVLETAGPRRSSSPCPPVPPAPRSPFPPLPLSPCPPVPLSPSNDIRLQHLSRQHEAALDERFGLLEGAVLVLDADDVVVADRVEGGDQLGPADGAETRQPGDRPPEAAAEHA